MCMIKIQSTVVVGIETNRDAYQELLDDGHFKIFGVRTTKTQALPKSPGGPLLPLHSLKILRCR